MVLAIAALYGSVITGRKVRKLVAFSDDVKAALAEAASSIENVGNDVLELAAKVEELQGRVLSAEDAADITSKAQAVAAAAKAAADVFKNSSES